MGHHILMGRKTYESIGRLLPGRTTVIITRNLDYKVKGAIVVHSLQAALEACGDDAEPFVIGGAEIFSEAIPIASKFYITEVLAEVEGDCWMPEIDFSDFNERSSEEIPASSKDEFASRFVIYQR